MLYIILVILIATFAILQLIYLFANKNTDEEKNLEQSINDIRLNLDELRIHAAQLAIKHKISKNAIKHNNLAKRISKLKKFFINDYRLINKDAKEEKYVAPAAEWFLDNFYIIEDQLNDIEQSLSEHHYKDLPVLISGTYKGYPRIYAIAAEIVSHTDGYIDRQVLDAFIDSYQQEKILTSSEIWALAIMLRIAIIQKIKVISSRIVKIHNHKKTADNLVAETLNMAADDEQKIKILIEKNLKDLKKLDTSFAERLLQQLRDQGSEAAPILEWLYEKLADQGISAEQIIKSEHKKQAEDQISIGNSITSLRFIDSIDWNKYFEKFSAVEKILSQDPIYADMDFQSRDYYRHKIEKISRKHKVSEIQIARKAMECSMKSDSNNEVAKHVGYYIIDDGKAMLEQSIGYKPGFIDRLLRRLSQYVDIIYILSVLLVTAFITYGITLYANNNTDSILLILLVVVVTLIPASDIGVKLINWIVTLICAPCFLPKLELRNGIPDDLATMVVVPTLLTDEKRSVELIHQLETYYLSNKEDNLFFAVLGDYVDAPFKEMGKDKAIINAALNEIKKLNKKYAKNNETDIFYLFHRERVWNASQNIWMGWERKRGKLIEFNRLIRGNKNTTYTVISGDITKLPKIKYIITLDADTQLPGETAKKLIGTCAHVLNKPVLNDNSTRVIKGYGILQPRIGISVTDAYNTIFSKIYSGQAGVDPYTTAVSDVYQDLFYEGIFTGKGIYDLDIFQKVLDYKLPENAILSHDLLEGSYARAALVSDIELVDGYPSKYNSYSARLHRWVRGDWQLLPWLKRRVKDQNGHKVENPINTISKWKIIDNLRRSLLPISVMLLIILGVVLLPGSPYIWVIFALVTLAMPLFSCMLNSVKIKDNTMSFMELISDVFDDIKYILIQVVLSVIFLPHQAYLMTDAITRTIVRMYFTKKNMLEWQTAADVERRSKNNFKAFIINMWPAQAINIIFLVLVISLNRQLYFINAVVFMLWLISPYVAFYISQPLKDKKPINLTQDQKDILFRLSRKIWRYFEDFVGPEDNWLAPDNYQEQPNNGIAHRTSPTNIGLWLASVVSARDMGYINTSRMIELVENTFNTLDKLKKWKGHFFNWYDTKTTQPMRPYYISTVDSGNMIGYLIVVKNALKQYMDKPLLDDSLIRGIQQTEKMYAYEYQQRLVGYDIAKNFLNKQQKTVKDWYLFLEDMENRYKHIDDVQSTENYKQKLIKNIQYIKQEIDLLFNWASEIELLPNELTEIKVILEEICKHTSLNKLIEELEHVVCTLGPKHLEIKDKLKFSLAAAKSIKERICTIIGKAEQIIKNTDFTSLYNNEKQLFSIGYNLESEQLTDSYYDLLASEARQASYIAIAKGDIPLKHWFKLNRPVTKSGKNKILVSWSGTMFEYLMPLLIMKNYKHTLLDQTYKSVIIYQKKYCQLRNVPWGISESGFYAFDMHMNYQYKAFGIPILGFKHTLTDDLVVTPYATMLALMVDYYQAFQNIKLLIQENMEGKYGMYEAVDYTKERMKKGKDKQIVKSYMVHHQGMSFLALNNFFNSNILQERFHSEPEIKAQQLLLQERVNKGDVLTKQYQEDTIDIQKIHQEDIWVNRRFKTANTIFPEAHILSNGKYMTVITNSGGGFTAYGDVLINRWREDTTCDNWGTFIYIRNLNSNSVWSATMQPFDYKPKNYKVNFYSDKAEFFRRDGDIDTKTEITVCPQNNVEIRRITLTNHSQHSRVLDVTSYFEIMLSSIDDDVAHPAFNKLFIQTEYIKDYQLLLANRRAKSNKHKNPWLAHTVVLEGNAVGDISYDTDREKFIGRGRSFDNPISMEPEHPLSNTVGIVIDPIMSIRQRLKIQPGGTAKISFITAFEQSKQKVVEVIKKYKDASAIQRSFEMAWTRGQIEMHYLGISSNQASSYQRLGSRIIYMTPEVRARAEYIKKNTKSQSALWRYGISGDLPIMIVRVKDQEDIKMFKKFLLAHEYLGMKGLKYDLLVLDDCQNSYDQSIHQCLVDILTTCHARELLDKKGGVFLRKTEHIDEQDLNLLMAFARVVYSGDAASITQHLKVKMFDKKLPDKLVPKKKSIKSNVSVFNKPELIYFNGLGGFTKDGREYVIVLDKHRNTPLPWSNVISNPRFGCVVTESGLGYTWAGNSRQNKLTPWNNDPVSDQAGEVIYVRDEDTGDVWTVTPLPIRDDGQYIIRHGQGYTVFKHACNGLDQEITVFVADNDPVKICMVKTSNISGQRRNISLTYYADLVMGVNRGDNSQFIITEFDNQYKVLMARNSYNEDFNDKIAFLSVLQAGGEISYTGDRSEFIGRNRTLKNPAAMSRIRLSGRCGAGYDPCAAMQTKICLKVGEVKYHIFLLGETSDREEIKRLAKYYDINNVQNELKKVKQKWKNYQTAVQISTPDKSMDILVNNWLLYQVISCRLWARSAFYQSGGAFGFRDQLQDVMSLVYLSPDHIKKHVLTCAAHQFIEGDVQHWWHAEKNKGVRTKISDDLLWLPYVVLDYINTSGDYSILDEQVEYLEHKQLESEQIEIYDVPKVSKNKDSIYKHCIKAIEKAIKFGPHGLPLIGAGDWNDGMNNIGIKGSGESVWLAWFLYIILTRFSDICIKKDDTKTAQRYRQIADKLIENIERNAWDGAWYRRAYFDDGTPLGSEQNYECKIDVIAQSWAAIAGAAKSSRIKEAMNAVEHYLIKREDGMILLFTPPFNDSDVEPGYIKGYVPGVRENGGQYTHGAVWTVLAYAYLGDGDKAGEFYSMLNPINHSRTAIEYSRYKVEPYVMAADVYSAQQHRGRGGWTWYTGSASWMYRTAVEWILGLKKRGDYILIDPCIPSYWEEYEIRYKYKQTLYIIHVKNKHRLNKGVLAVYLDGERQQNNSILLNNDKSKHFIEVIMGHKGRE